MQLLPKPRKNRSQPQSLEIERSLESSQPSSFDSTCIEASVTPFRAHPSVEKQHERVVVLIDGANLFYAASYLSLEVDYIKLLRYLVQERRLVRAYFYTGVDRANDKQQGFLHWMRRHGYRVVDKDLIQFPDGSKKANVEVEIAVDMMTLASYCDTMVLLSGDGNLAYAVNAITYQGVQVEIVSLRSMTSDSLINVADCYTDLDTIKQHIQR